MYILPYLLDICSKNLLIQGLSCEVKKLFTSHIETMIYDNSKNRYVNLMFKSQEIINELMKYYIVQYFQIIDDNYKNSIERKSKYFINKSNVQRTIVTIYGTITFQRTLYQDKITKEYYFYVDDVVGLESYYTYDPVVRAIYIEDSTYNNPNLSSFHSPCDVFNLIDKYQCSTSENIPKQTIYRWKRDIKIREIQYKEIEVSNKTLYVMVDEKWIHEQDKTNPQKKKWIMSKCFVTFTGINRKGKRSRLVGRHVFITSSQKPWKDFMNEIYKIYNFEEINTINLLSDAGSWILSGKDELKLYSNNKVIVNTCEFHVKQKINRSTTDKDLRLSIANIIYETEDKKKFKEEMNKLIESKSSDKRKQKVTEYMNYILKHWKGIINMKHSLCKSSMEAHIQHVIACSFSEVPKAYSKNNIEVYLKVQEMKVNQINLFTYYLNSYNTEDDFVFNQEKEVDFSIFEKSTSILPAVTSVNPVSKTLHSMAYPRIF